MLNKANMRITTEEFEHYRAKQRDKQVQHEKAIARLRGADEQYYVTVTHLMKLATMARELFEEAEIYEKRELIGLVGSNLFLDGKKLLFNLVKPFDTLALCNDNSLWLGMWYDFRTS